MILSSVFLIFQYSFLRIIFILFYIVLLITFFSQISIRHLWFWSLISNHDFPLFLHSYVLGYSNFVILLLARNKIDIIPKVFHYLCYDWLSWNVSISLKCFWKVSIFYRLLITFWYDLAVGETDPGNFPIFPLTLVSAYRNWFYAFLVFVNRKVSLLLII